MLSGEFECVSEVQLVSEFSRKQLCFFVTVIQSDFMCTGHLASSIPPAPSSSSYNQIMKTSQKLNHRSVFCHTD